MNVKKTESFLCYKNQPWDTRTNPEIQETTLYTRTNPGIQEPTPETRINPGIQELTLDTITNPEKEFKEFEPRFKSAKTRFKFSAGLNLETFDTILSRTNHI